LGEPALARRIPVLRQQASALERRASSESRVVAVVVLLGLGLVAALVAGVASLILH
ncbi:MAG: hypothetical protein JNG84_06070, partial [Archangium sp.]|nr:hypothetical protein [Archangium sp.]